MQVASEKGEREKRKGHTRNTSSEEHRGLENPVDKCEEVHRQIIQLLLYLLLLLLFLFNGNNNPLVKCVCE